MIAPDVNLLVHAFDQESSSHQRAKVWLESVLSGNESIGFVWNVLLGFLRISTNPKALPKPLSIEEALELVGHWLAQPNVVILHSGPRHFELLRDLLIGVGTRGSFTSDAHLAAIALEHGAEVYSADADFSRFPGLRWHNPLAS